MRRLLLPNRGLHSELCRRGPGRVGRVGWVLQLAAGAAVSGMMPRPAGGGGSIGCGSVGGREGCVLGRRRLGRQSDNGLLGEGEGGEEGRNGIGREKSGMKLGGAGEKGQKKEKNAEQAGFMRAEVRGRSGPRAFVSCLGILLALGFGVVSAAGGAVAATGAGKDSAQEVRFDVKGPEGRETILAKVEVQKWYAYRPKPGLSSWLRFRWFPRAVAEGVNVRLESLDFSALSRFSMKLREKARGRKVEIAHLRLYGPGETVPCLIAREVEMKTQDVWTLRRVLLAGRPSLAACTLDLKRKPSPELRPLAGSAVSLQTLLQTGDDP